MRGQTLDGVQLNDIYEGLKLNEINNYSHILTGTTLQFAFHIMMNFRLWFFNWFAPDMITSIFLNILSLLNIGRVTHPQLKSMNHIDSNNL